MNERSELRDMLNIDAISFKDKEHKEFFIYYLPKCRQVDVYHAALIYCLGISEETRKNIDSIYDFEKGTVDTNCLHEGWITSGSAKVVRMAFNLYCDIAPSVSDYDDKEKQLEESELYSVSEIFCCGYAKYFWQAIRLRYPEYC